MPQPGPVSSSGIWALSLKHINLCLGNENWRECCEVGSGRDLVGLPQHANQRNHIQNIFSMRQYPIPLAARAFQAFLEAAPKIRPNADSRSCASSSVNG